ncbi:MAG TPA: 3-oxoacyl-ACP reductase [Nevskiaceae bacterium]|nr:3-oxoacyl-ACP reductase [Nevskiaceae bacterium]
MSDRYLEFSHSAFGKQLASLLGLPQPPRLRRAREGYGEQPLAGRRLLVGGDREATASRALLDALAGAGAELHIVPEHSGLAPLKQAAAAAGLGLKGEPAEGGFKPDCLVFDATGVADAGALRAVYDFFQPRVGKLAPNGRVLLIGRAPSTSATPEAWAAASALRGFVRSLGKEVGPKGSTANLIELEGEPGAGLHGALRFFLSEHSAFVCGQVLTLGEAERRGSWTRPLEGRRALVTGAARGIGAAIAQTLAREGAQVIGMDRPQEEGALGETMSRLGGQGLALDVTDPRAGERLLAEIGALDVVVHNAGVTRDKMLRNMAPHLWDQVLEINLGAILRINRELLAGKGLNPGARIVCISSIGGIAGNAGQTNYGATKAGVIGYVEAMAPLLARQGGAINAVAPGFIETQMTAQMPMGPREVGRRLNALSQGGLPIDIAEAVTFLASPLAAGVNGRTLRVCGQNFVGA